MKVWTFVSCFDTNDFDGLFVFQLFFCCWNGSSAINIFLSLIELCVLKPNLGVGILLLLLLLLGDYLDNQRGLCQC